MPLDFRRGLWIAVAVHLALSLVALVVVAIASDDALVDQLAIWDGGHYLHIAGSGYETDVDPSAPYPNTEAQDLAFLPLYPLVIKVVGAVTPFGLATSGVLISIVAAAVAAAGIYTLCARLTDSPLAGVYAAAVWSALPLSIVTSMVYTEALFVALGIWALVKALDGRWLSAGALALAAGLTRPTGLCVGLAVLVSAVVFLRANRDAVRWRPIVGGLLALAGTPLWWVYVGAATGQPRAWFEIQERVYGSQFDGGVQFIRTSLDTLTLDPSDDSLDGLTKTPAGIDQAPLVFVFTLIFCLIAVVLAVLLIRRAIADRRWVGATTYAVAGLALALGGAGAYPVRTRFLLALAPLVFPIAIQLARARTTTAIASVGVLAAGGIWWSAYMLTEWVSAI